MAATKSKSQQCEIDAGIFEQIEAIQSLLIDFLTKMMTCETQNAKRKAQIARIVAQIAANNAKIAEIVAQNAEIEAEVAEMEAQIAEWNEENLRASRSALLHYFHYFCKIS